MHNQRTAIIIAAITGIISSFLPFVSTWIKKQSLIESGEPFAYLIIIAFIITLIVSLQGEKKLPMTGGTLAGAIIPGIIPGIILILMAIGQQSDDFARVASKFESGFYLMLIASIAIPILGLALKGYTAEPITRASDYTEKSFCTNCGNQIPDAPGQFCEECGNKL